jgi:hypothetical protein
MQELLSHPLPISKIYMSEDCWKSIKEWAKVLLDKTDPWKDRIERMKA